MVKITIHNVETGEIVEREMNLDEVAQWDADQLATEAKEQAKTQAALAKAALLNRLGITEEEARLLLGGN